MTYQRNINVQLTSIRRDVPVELATTAALYAKINKVKIKISNITNLATTTALTAVEKKNLMLVIYTKKPSKIQKLVKLKKKVSDYDHDKYITLQNLIS